VKRNLAIQVIDRLFIVAYGATSPTDEEWSDYLGLVQRHGIDRTQHIIFTEGGAPTSAQRRRVAALLDGRAVPVAVLSASARVRAMVTALSWLNPRIKAFPPSALPEALDFLDVPASRADLIAGALHKLRADVDQEAAASGPPPVECVAEIGDAMLARVDAQAARLGAPREEVLARCIARGLDEIEGNKPAGKDVGPSTRPRRAGDAGPTHGR
jgi:hypothetical protein